MLNHMSSSGHGLTVCHDYLSGCGAYGDETKTACYRLFTAAAKAYCNESARGEEEVLTLMLDQLQAFGTLSKAANNGNVPEAALVYALQPFGFLGRAPRVQSQARTSGLLNSLGGLLLSENVKLQDAAVTALGRLQEDCLENRKALTQANVPFLLCPLLE